MYFSNKENNSKDAKFARENLRYKTFIKLKTYFSFKSV